MQIWLRSSRERALKSSKVRATGNLSLNFKIVNLLFAAQVTLAVRFDVLHVLPGKLLNRGNDLSVGLVGPIPLDALITHVLGREVRVAPRSVPVSAARLRVEPKIFLTLILTRLERKS